MDHLRRLLPEGLRHTWMIVPQHGGPDTGLEIDIALPPGAVQVTVVPADHVGSDDLVAPKYMFHKTYPPGTRRHDKGRAL